MSKIIGTFASRDSAESCIRELRNSGFDHNRISLVARESGKKDEGGQGSVLLWRETIQLLKVPRLAEPLEEWLAFLQA
jgi:hypothetical protein